MPSQPVPPSSESFAQHQVRLGVSADAPALDAWLQAAMPLPVPAARARRLVLEGLLAQSGQGACLLAMHEDDIAACLPVALVSSLEFGGLVACVTEWWSSDAAASGSGCLMACLATLADWCRAHGIRHLLLAPGLAADVPTGFARHHSGLWHRMVVPAPKTLG